MTLDLSRLENVRQRVGKTLARCPACAEEQRDDKGEHLAIFPDGRFACVAHPGVAGKNHRRRILALAGDPKSRCIWGVGIQPRRPAKTNLPGIAELLDGIGRFGRVSLTYAHMARCAHTEVCKVNEKTHTRTALYTLRGSEKSSNPSTPVQPDAQQARGSRQAADTVSQHLMSFVRAIPETVSQPAPPLTRQAPLPECGDPLIDTALAAFDGHRQADTTTQDIDPETGFPILGGAVCPF